MTPTAPAAPSGRHMASSPLYTLDAVAEVGDQTGGRGRDVAGGVLEGDDVGDVGEQAARARRRRCDGRCGPGRRRRSTGSSVAARRPGSGPRCRPAAAGCSTGRRPGRRRRRAAATWRVSSIAVAGVVRAGAGDDRDGDGLGAPRRPQRRGARRRRAPTPRPVVPATTRPSLPWSCSHRATAAAASRSSAAVGVERRDHGGEDGAEAPGRVRPCQKRLPAIGRGRGR